jgi:hypothetical protein
MKTLGNHFVATNADKPGPGVSLPQGSDQPGTENISRCLSCNDAKGRCLAAAWFHDRLADDAAVRATQ